MSAMPCRHTIPSLSARGLRLWWLGHVGRMPGERVARQVLFGQLRGTRPGGSTPVTLRGLMRKRCYFFTVVGVRCMAAAGINGLPWCRGRGGRCMRGRGCTLGGAGGGGGWNCISMLPKGAWHGMASLILTAIPSLVQSASTTMGRGVGGGALFVH